MLLGRKLGGGRNIPKKSGMALITYEKDHENSGSSNSPEPNSTSCYISGSSLLVSPCTFVTIIQCTGRAGKGVMDGLLWNCLGRFNNTLHTQEFLTVPWWDGTDESFAQHRFSIRLS